MRHGNIAQIETDHVWLDIGCVSEVSLPNAEAGVYIEWKEESENKLRLFILGEIKSHGLSVMAFYKMICVVTLLALLTRGKGNIHCSVQI